MIKKNTEKDEFDHFDNLHNEWWKTDGKFKILHTITPLRIKYIKDNIQTKLKNTENYKKLLKNLKILDMGCGGGLVCEPLARLGAEVTGIDFVKKNIDIAKKHAKSSNLKINYFQNNLSNLKLKSKFDLILILEVIEHLDNWKEVSLEAIKYLKPNGKIIFSSINRTFFSKIFAIFLSEEILKWTPKNTHKYQKLVKPEELIKHLEKNKMKKTDLSGMFFNPISRDWQISKKRTRINYFCTFKKIS